MIETNGREWNRIRELAGKGIKVLIVDDDPAIIKVTSLLLKTEGHVPLEALRGREGLKIALKESPDLILLDIMMPGIDGYEFCRRLKEDERTADIPVIFVTAIQDHDEEATSAAVGLLRKPFLPEELLSLVRSAAGQG